jgi:hypothetical protein
MTTPAAEALYLAHHRYQLEGRKRAVFNPHEKPLDALPVIYGFNNGGSRGWYSAVAMAEDGTCLGGHCCSDEGYMEGDLGIIEGARPDRHADQYQKHYPDGYRMEFVPGDEVKQHEALNRAFALNQKQAAEEKC